MSQELLERWDELRAAAHLHRGAVSQQLLGDLCEVVHGGAEHNRLAEAGRFQGVLPSVRDEAAADHGDRRQAIVSRQLPKGIHDADVPPLLRTRLADPPRRQPGLADQPFHFGDALKMPRGE